MTETLTSPVRYYRLADPAAGVRAYMVTRGSDELGTVTNRRGGYWRAFTVAGELASSSFCRTRAEATASLVERTDLATAAADAGVTIPVELPTEPVVVEEQTRAGVTALITSDDDGIVAVECASCSAPLVDDDRSPFYDADADDGRPHACPPAPEAPVLRAALLDAGARVIARERVDAARLRYVPSIDAAYARIAGMVAVLAELLDVDEDTVVEAVGERYAALVEA